MTGVDDLNRIAADLSRAGRESGRRARQVVRKTALDVEATAKQFVPVDTGNLKNSIGTDVILDGGEGRIEAVVGPTAEYGAYVEFGTSRQAPAAYMGPALDRHSPGFAAGLTQLGGRIL